MKKSYLLSDAAFKLDGKMPLSQAIPLGLQHVLAMFLSLWVLPLASWVYSNLFLQPWAVVSLPMVLLSLVAFLKASWVSS